MSVRTFLSLAVCSLGYSIAEVGWWIGGDEVESIREAVDLSANEEQELGAYAVGASHLTPKGKEMVSDAMNGRAKEPPKEPPKPLEGSLADRISRMRR